MVMNYLSELFNDAPVDKLSGVVIGCTHYSYLKNDLKTLLGHVPLFDGAEGAARQLHRVLKEHGLLAEQTGEIRFETSGGPEGIALMERFYHLAEEMRND